jgi:VanZ family protein
VPRAESVHRTAIVASLLLIAAATLVPNADGVWPRDFWGWRADAIEFALNVLLFAPLGAALALSANVRKALLAITATTIAIELLQYFVIAGRDGSIRDVIANFGGGAGGLLVAPHLRSLWRPDVRTGRRLAWSGSALWIAHAVFAMVVFRPSMTDNPLFTHIAPELGQYDRFAGTVANASVNGATVFSGRFPAGKSPKSWEFQRLELAATATTAPPTPRLAPVLALIDSAGFEIALLGKTRGDLVFRTRTLADDFGLRLPVLVIDDAFAPSNEASREPIRVTGYRDRYMLSASAAHADGNRRAESITLTPSLGWSLWWSFDVPSTATITWMTWLWLAVPIGAIAFWSAASATKPRAWTASLPGAVAVLVAHLLVPRAFFVAPLGNKSEALALAIGLLVGLGLGARLASRRQPTADRSLPPRGSQWGPPG